jgi:GMP synthase-like glutamine amidotransferase
MTLKLQHRDQVTVLPPKFELLASTTDCYCHSMIKLRDDHPAGQVITMQGHPELTRDMTAFLMAIRLKSEVLSESEVLEAWKRVDGSSGSGGADEDIAGWAMLDFMLEISSEKPYDWTT